MRACLGVSKYRCSFPSRSLTPARRSHAVQSLASVRGSPVRQGASLAAVTGAAITVFIVASPGTETRSLADSLSASSNLTIATVGSGSLAALANAVSGGRFVFLAGHEDEPSPEELAPLGPERGCRVERERLLADPRASSSACAASSASAMTRRCSARWRRRRARAAPRRGASPFASESTDTFARALEQAGSSLLVSTYQTNRWSCARATDGRAQHPLPLPTTSRWAWRWRRGGSRSARGPRSGTCATCPRPRPRSTPAGHPRRLLPPAQPPRHR